MHNSLTKRENQVLKLILAEMSNAAIAEQLEISEKTVESHRKSIYLKTGTKTIVGLVKFVIQSKIIRIN
ncbi:response regulator transcription factor [Reichenbachiella faecimaris]|uniref:response regulator transcription factor n=1 Tax=Reichenbachiella faecimaris TaxID=692418 RepID=UPI000A01D1F7|nr:helix-turn-helix transcriptional regulator [Reichenbachiella faecimaris]